MKWILSLLLGTLVVSANGFARTDLLDAALETRRNVIERMEDCGLNELAAHDPRLPRPVVPAHRAYVDSERGWMPGYHYRATLGGGQDFRWIRPNGASVAWMTVVADESVEFGTTTGGTLARMNRAFTVGGEIFYYWCRSVQVDEPTFRQCVEAYWVQYLLTAFCAR